MAGSPRADFTRFDPGDSSSRRCLRCSHIQRVEDQLGARTVCHRLLHDVAAEHVEHHGQEHEPPGRHVGDVGRPEPVGRFGFEASFEQVRHRPSVRLRARVRVPRQRLSPPPTPVHASTAPRASCSMHAPELRIRREPEARRSLVNRPNLTAYPVIVSGTTRTPPTLSRIEALARHRSH